MTPQLKASGVKTLTGFLCLMLAAQAMRASPFGNLHDPATVASWEISGNRAITEETIRSWITMKAGTEWSPETYLSDLDRIRSGYASEGFFEARVKTEALLWLDDSSSVGITISVDEGRRARIADVRFVGANSFALSEISAESELSAGQAFRSPPPQTGTS
jgi:outer membrane protein insertion porin family